MTQVERFVNGEWTLAQEVEDAGAGGLWVESEIGGVAPDHAETFGHDVCNWVGAEYRIIDPDLAESGQAWVLSHVVPGGIERFNLA